MRRLCVIVLVMEVIVIGLAIPVAVRVDHAPARAAGIAGGACAALALVLAAAARWQLRWTVAGGSLLQVLVIVSGIVVPVMYFLGAVFGALWLTGIWLGRRAERAALH